MSDIKEFHLDSSPSVVLLECIEVKHSLWPNPLRYVTNNANGITVTHEDSTQAVYEYMPLAIQKGKTSDDLDQSINITIGELGQIVPQLIKIILDANSEEKPQVIYRSYLSSDLTAPVDVIYGLEVETMNQDYQACTFEAVAQRLNSVGTGRIYTTDMFPSLKGFF
ncbi:DUF1833 family protein [Acinetobacter pittii]|uniref:DUF1833 family protein n=1 Tax=Acinetobacter pittii TaxID=48296 RepID=UPI0024780A36|nr:DUF1833 family protein [Acinetobacter pittii]WGO87973.1 DUF1833 family protein [Acinetobacter pittii]